MKQLQVLLALIGVETIGAIACHLLPAFASIAIAILMSLVTATVVVVMLVSVLRDGLGANRKTLAVATAAFVGIASITVYFGYIFLALGIKSSDGAAVTNIFDAIYFSVVTWATLGYGDYTPSTVAAKVFVMIESTAGYFVMALLIAAFTESLRRR